MSTGATSILIHQLLGFPAEVEAHKLLTYPTMNLTKYYEQGCLSGSHVQVSASFRAMLTARSDEKLASVISENL